MRMAMILLGTLFTASAASAGDGKPPPYPDLSSPNAAAFSLGVALAQADVKTARTIYIGDDKEFSVLLAALVKFKGSADKLRRAVETRFGKNPATFGLRNVDADFKVGRSSLPALMATAEVKQTGDTAVGACGLILGLVLKKQGQDWKVTDMEWPTLPLKAVVDVMDVMAAATDEIVREVEQGKYRHVYQVYAAYHRVAVTQIERAKGQLDLKQAYLQRFSRRGCARSRAHLPRAAGAGRNVESLFGVVHRRSPFLRLSL